MEASTPSESIGPKSLNGSGRLDPRDGKDRAECASRHGSGQKKKKKNDQHEQGPLVVCQPGSPGQVSSVLQGAAEGSGSAIRMRKTPGTESTSPGAKPMENRLEASSGATGLFPGPSRCACALP